MNQTITLMTVSRDARVIEEIGDAAMTTGCFSETRSLESVAELTVALEQNGAAAVVVDVDDRPQEMLEELEPLIERFAGMRVIVVASEQRQEWMIQAMQAGARHFLAKSAIATELSDVLKRLRPAESVGPGSDTRAVVSIMSAGGGCGATTLAVNLAEELGRLSKGSTLVVDLDCAWGGVTGYLDVTAKYGIADVLADARRIDADLIRSTAARYSDRLNVLASPAAISFQDADSLSYEHLSRALRSARQAYEYTIVDAPRLTTQGAVDLARSSDLTIMVLESNIEDIRIARRRLEELIERGVPRDRIVALVNRYHRRRTSVPWSEMKRSLDFVQIGRLCNDYARVAAGINYGKPLAEISPRSPFRRDVHELAKSIYEITNNGHNFGKIV